MRLDQLLRGVETLAVRGDQSIDVSSVVADSRLAVAGSLFVAIPGTQKDGASFIESAISRGAAVIVSTGHTDQPASVTQVEVSDARRALAVIAANFYGRPSEALSIIGVTGTSGKTTTTKMVESILDVTGDPVGLIGTIEYRAGTERLMADRTTPDAVVLQQWFRRMVDAGVRSAVMEVSSHALSLERTFGVRFAAAVFTNLTRDHLDFHKDFEDYYQAKRILFDQIDRSKQCAIVNVDDAHGRRLATELGSSVVTFGRSAEAMIHPLDGFEISVRGLHGQVQTPSGVIRVDSDLIGVPNLYNWMGAIGAAQSVGFKTPTIEAGIRSLKSVRGRFERVPGSEGPTVIVDYAHKPDALEKLLHAVRELSGERRIVVVFGCGGDRDKGKRPIMGEIAGRLADHVILTSDNPRSEKAETILDEIESGITVGGHHVRMADRRAAIVSAVTEAGDDDVVVIAGKGHEPYQVIGDQVNHFDDLEEALIALKTRTENTQR